MPITFDEQFDLYLSAKNVGPEARNKLKGLLKYYAEKPHPFRACVKDNRKRFGPGTERVCATLKDIIRGTTHWRGHKSDDKGSAGLANLSEPKLYYVPQEIVDVLNDGLDKYDQVGATSLSDVATWARDTTATKTTDASGLELLLSWHQTNSASDDPLEGSDIPYLLHGGDLGRAWASAQNQDLHLAETMDSDLVSMLDELSDEDLHQLISLAQDELNDDEGPSNSEDKVWDSPPAKANYRETLKDGVNCASCEHFEDNFCSYYVAKVEPEMLCDKFESEGASIDYYKLSELYFSESPIAIKDDANGVWKTVLKTGQWQLSPGANGPVRQPMTVIRGANQTDAKNRVISLDDIVDTFKQGAVQHVTVPLEHTKDPDKNTGYVRDLKLEKGQDGSDYLKALIEFTEPDIESKVLNGSIANTSVGLRFGYQRKKDGAAFPVALDHVALTNKPWIDGLPGFGLSEQEDTDVPVFVYTNTDGGKDMDPVVDDTTKEASNLQLSDLQDENAQLAAENAQLRAESRKSQVSDRIAELSDQGLGEFPGFLTKVKEIMLADTGDAVLELSEDGDVRSLTASDVIEELLKALPRKSGLNLSDQANDTGAPRPSDTDEKPVKDRVKETAEFLGIDQG